MERRKILIATKTYPSISTKYQETVCTAGVLLDDDEKPVQWIRIYPIRFRQLDFDKRYPRWSIIQQLYRNCRDKSNETSMDNKEKEALKKVRQKLEDEFLSKKDLYFIMGNLKSHKNSFMIIGIFYPLLIKM
ncbi:hypothetical protein [Nostoc sp.]|uniref:hypothetical protein n=1 Tax=Nostoc sp. TaxID=1180 RepID=UPI002FF5B355